MKKDILISATVALLVLPNLSSIILADPPETPDDAGTHPRFSAEDFAVFTDARIAAVVAARVAALAAASEMGNAVAARAPVNAAAVAAARASSVSWAGYLTAAHATDVARKTDRGRRRER